MFLGDMFGRQKCGSRHSLVVKSFPKFSVQTIYNTVELSRQYNTPLLDPRTTCAYSISVFDKDLLDIRPAHMHVIESDVSKDLMNFPFFKKCTRGLSSVART